MSQPKDTQCFEAAVSPQIRELVGDGPPYTRSESIQEMLDCRAVQLKPPFLQAKLGCT